MVVYVVSYVYLSGNPGIVGVWCFHTKDKALDYIEKHINEDHYCGNTLYTIDRSETYFDHNNSIYEIHECTYETG